MPHAVTRRRFLASAAALAVGFRTAAAAELPVTGTADPALKPFDDLLTKFLADNAVPGAAVAVSRRGKLVYARGFGYADVERKRPVEPDATFRIASVSKPITAVAVLQLAEAGKLKLDAPALDYVTLKPFLADGDTVDERWKKVTIRQCLRHTGGWDRNRKGGYDPIAIPGRITRAMNLPGAPSPEDVVRYMLGKPLDFDPGERMAYSNLGYLILGRAIETISGQKYEPWVREHVLEPVGAKGLYLGRGIPENRPQYEVRYYDSKMRTGVCLYPPRVGGLVPVPDGAGNVEGYEAHGGWVASAVDLVRFASAFDAGRKSPLLSPGYVQAMWARPEGSAGYDAAGQPKDAYYGCGWSVRPADGATMTAWHSGLIPGTSTLLVRRHDGFCWAVLFNTEANPGGQVLSGLIDGPMHVATDAVTRWPDVDFFENFRG